MKAIVPLRINLGNTMAFFLAPLAIKGAIVLGKFIISHHASAAVAKGAVVAVKTMGTAQALTLAGTGLTIVGFGMWSVERILMCQNAVELFAKGQPVQAANELSKLAKSFSIFEGGDLLDQIRDWIAHGSDLASPALDSIISGLREVLDEAARTSRTLHPA